MNILQSMLGDIQSAHCDMIDVRNVLSKQMLNKPKDNEGTECTIGMCLDDTIDTLSELESMAEESSTMWVCIVPLAYDIMSLAEDEQTAIKLATSKAAAYLNEKGLTYDRYRGQKGTGEKHTPDSVLEFFGSRTYEIKPSTAIVCC
jgi:hypothetical protein